MNKLLNVLEIADLLGVSRAQIYKLINKGLPVIKVGHNTRFNSEDVFKWIEEQNKKTKGL